MGPPLFRLSRPLRDLGRALQAGKTLMAYAKWLEGRRAGGEEGLGFRVWGLAGPGPGEMGQL